MSLYVSSVQPSNSLHILLEQQSDGQVRASVAELFDCSVSRSTREEVTLAIGGIIATRNQRDFSLVANLTLENWVSP